jgi:hypothetical protein
MKPKFNAPFKAIILAKAKTNKWKHC